MTPDAPRGSTADALPPGHASRDAESRFPRPPLSFVDRVGRSITVREDGEALDSLAEMYAAFDDADRAQGLPPRGADRRRSWLRSLLEAGVHLVARDGDRAVGHAALLEMADGRHELVVFVAPDHQLAGIGTRLVRALLGAGRARGVTDVWLTVERHNRVAKAIYASVGFEPASRGRVWEMERAL